MKDSTLCPRFEKGMKFLVNDGQHSLFTNFSLDLSAFVLESSLPVSGRLLSERLKELELEGIVERKVFPETPVRIEYF